MRCFTFCLLAICCANVHAQQLTYTLDDPDANALRDPPQIINRLTVAPPVVRLVQNGEPLPEPILTVDPVFTRPVPVTAQVDDELLAVLTQIAAQQTPEAIPVPTAPQVSDELMAVLAKLLAHREESRERPIVSQISPELLSLLVHLLSSERLKMSTPAQFQPRQHEATMEQFLKLRPEIMQTIVSDTPQFSVPASARHQLALPNETRMYGVEHQAVQQYGDVRAARQMVETIDTKRKWSEIYRILKGITLTEVNGQLVEVTPCWFGPDRVRVIR